ncbi:superoxide dismutase family protein [Thiococcus pfennigii]|uniref:superoxide dismutase family protein n=1 Tax=Thiococcus pfennigii TaxID=1057 RepID=UPI001903765B|nr:superoxide dismutase family protein [Thiococcus pfennigii]
MVMNAFARRVAMIGWLALSACLATSAVAGDGMAGATLRDPDGNQVGTVSLRETPNGLLLHARLVGLPPGTHAFHLHETGVCEPPFKSAGGHFNPDDSAHGFLVEDGPHAGDMPNIHVPDGGTLEFEVLTLAAALKPDLLDDDGAAVVIHEGADDYESQPSGAAGPRIACGVIDAD